MASPGERAIDLALATVLVATPLLPSGPAYFGIQAPWLIDVVPLLLLALWAVSWGLTRSAGRPQPVAGSHQHRQGARPVVLAWLTVLVMLGGAAVLGLVREHRFDSPVFAEQLARLDWQSFLTAGQLDSSFYPLRVWWTFFEGGLSFLLVASICALASQPARRRNIALGGWLAGFVIVSALAIAQYFTGYALHPYWLRLNPDLTRSHATLDDPNSLGSYLALGIGISIALWCARRDHDAGAWSRRGAMLLIAVGIGALITTASRAAWIAVPSAVLLFVAYAPAATLRMFLPTRDRLYRTWARRVVLVGLVLTATVIVTKAAFSAEGGYRPNGLIDVLVQTVNPQVPVTRTLSGRVQWWGAAVQLAVDHPLTGIGLGRYPRDVQGMQIGGRSVVPENAHNLYLQLLAESGVLGLAAFSGLVLLTVAALFRPAESVTSDAVLRAGVGIGWLAYLATLLSGHPLLLPSQQVIVGCLLGAVIGGSPTAVPALQPRVLRRLVPGVVLVGVFAFGVAAATASGPRPNTRWGYSAGLYAEERVPRAHFFRWTSDRALLDVATTDDVRAVRLAFDVARPNMAADPVTTTVTYGDASGGRTFVDHKPAQHVISIELEPAVVAPGGRLLIRLDVTPPFVPAEGGSTDRRVLGVQLRPIRYRTVSGQLIGQ